jgi:hypothetical protein
LHKQKKLKKSKRGIRENRLNRKECSSRTCTGEIKKNQTNDGKELWSLREDSLKILQQQTKVENPCIVSVLVRWLAKHLKRIQQSMRRGIKNSILKSGYAG